MQPDEPSVPQQPPREAAVMFAELVGAAALQAQSSDRAQGVIDACLAELEGSIGGKARVVKRIGPRLMLLSESADTAARAAVAMEVAARGFAEFEANKLGLGVGFHFGPVIQNDADVFGDTVNLAARLVEKAAHGQILLTAETAERIGSLYRRSVRRLYALQLKGIEQDVSLCEIMWRADEPATFYPFDALPSEGSRAKLKLRYKGEKLTLRRIVEAVTIGRDAACKLVIQGEHASRHHCSIQRRGEHFTIADKSTNGTFVTIDGEEEVPLRRDEISLRKRGWISFGQPKSAGGDVLEFVCDDYEPNSGSGS